jgi:hypothetical protein
LNNLINIKSSRFNTIFIDGTEADLTFFIGWFSSMEQKRFHSSTKSMFQLNFTSGAPPATPVDMAASAR